MKKMLVLALAMIAFTAQSHAAAERDRDGKNDTRKIEKTREEAARGGKINSVEHSIKGIKSARLDANLSADESTKLQAALSRNADLSSAAAEIVSNNKPALEELNRSRVEGLMHLSKLDPRLLKKDANSALPEDKAKEAYAALVLNAGSQAEGSKSMAEQVSKVLKIANQELNRGKSYNDAMGEALTELKKATKSSDSIAQLMEKLKNLCNSRG